MRQKYLMIAVLVVSFTGLMNRVESLPLDDPENVAKVRVFQKTEITLYPGDYCYGSDNPAAIDTSNRGFSIFGTHTRVGMPMNDDIPGDYNEYVIQAGKPLTVMLKWEAEKEGVKASCGPIGSTFYPQAGKNYDVTIGYSGSCIVQIRELYETSPGKADARLTPAGASFACLKK